MYPLEKIKYIVIHCSATRCDRDYTAEQLEQDHRQRGFERAGYHFYIRKNGFTKVMRPRNYAGAHVQGYNKCSIGVCYEGGLLPDGTAADTRTPEQKEALIFLLGLLKKGHPEAQIVGHRDLSPDLNGDGIISPNEWIKICPCFDAKTEYKNL